MKRCPECRRDYFDDSLLYCLEDGTALVYGPVEAPPTAILSGDPSGDDRTRLFRDAPISIGHQPPSTQPVGQRSARRWYWLAGGALIVIVAGVAVAIYRPWARTERPVGTLQIERLTTNGRATSAAISPDGKYVIYGVDEGGKDSLWLRQVAAQSNVQIFPAAEDVYYWGLTFTPDSDHVNFIRAEFEKNIGWGLNQMPVLGGQQKMLLKHADGPVSYSPDGKQFAFIRNEFPGGDESSLMIANADGTGERAIATRKAPETFPSRRVGPAWSPDGRTIAAIIGDETTLLARMSVVEVDVATGAVKPLKTHEWKFIDQIAWLSDKSGIMVLGSDRESPSYSSQIWHFSHPDGKPQRITADLDYYRSLSLNGDSSLMVAVRANNISNIWSAGSDWNKPSQIRSGGSNEEGQNGLSLAPDGRVVFFSTASGRDDIWIMNADGSSPSALTGEGPNAQPAVSPDGQYIVFSRIIDFNVNLWRMRLDGSELTQLTTGTGDYEPTFSPDAKWIIYTSKTAGKSFLWKMAIDGSQRSQLLNNFASVASISPDGKWIACSWRKDENSTWRYAIVPFEGGEPIKVFDLIGKKGSFRWAPDSKSLYYLRDTGGGVTNIWNLPLPDGEPRQVTDYKTETIFDFVLSPDGKNLVMSRGNTMRDVVLMKGF